MRKTVSIILSVLVFFTPLIFGTPTHESFEFPKITFVYLLGGTAIWLWALSTKNMRLPPIPILWFVGAYAISSLFSTHPYTSFWGYYTRWNGGLLSVLIFLGIVTVLYNEFHREEIKQFVYTMALAAIPVSAYAISQHFNLIPNIWVKDQAIRAFSTFGQPNWMAAFLAMAAPIALINLVMGEKREKIFWGGVYILSFSALWFAYSLSGLAGFAAGVVCFWFLNKGDAAQNYKILGGLLVASAFIAGSNLGIFDEKIRDIFIDVKKIYAQTEPQVSDPGYIRTTVWTGSLHLFLSSPKTFLIGTGPETFPYEFQQFRPSDLNYSSEWDFLINKPHNYYLELLTNIGVVGTVFYLLILRRTLRPADKTFTPPLLALYVSNIFGWPTVTTTLLFWILVTGIYKDARN